MNERLGFGINDRLLIINADDLGVTQGTNQAIMRLFHNKAISSASIMMPCPAAGDAAALCSQSDGAHIGIHLTLTSNDNGLYKPVYQERSLNSLTAAGGCFYHDPAELERRADPDEVRIELEAQIQTAISLGLQPTHGDSHGG